MKVGYANGFNDGRISTLQDFERVLAVLREEMADLRRDRDLQMQRADAAADLLLQHLGTRAISLAGKAEETARTERHVRAVSSLSSIVDPTADLPYDHPLASYKSSKDASLFNGEDVGSSDG